MKRFLSVQTNRTWFRELNRFPIPLAIAASSSSKYAAFATTAPKIPEPSQKAAPQVISSDPPSTAVVETPLPGTFLFPLYHQTTFISYRTQLLLKSFVRGH